MNRYIDITGGISKPCVHPGLGKLISPFLQYIYNICKEWGSKLQVWLFDVAEKRFVLKKTIASVFNVEKAA